MDEDDDLETLGEQLYTLIHPKHNEEAGKLTGEVTFLQKKCSSRSLMQLSEQVVCFSGMLLELPASVLTNMLQDEALLTAAVEKARRALQLVQEPRYEQKLVSVVSKQTFCVSRGGL